MSRIIEGYITDPRANVVAVTSNYTTNTADGVVNVNAATAEITIAPVYNVGKRLLIRKINSTTGDINILFSGSEVVTKASLTSISLQTDGDFWLLEKVANNRWELLDGYESLTNGNTRYRKSYDSSVFIQFTHSVGGSTGAEVAGLSRHLFEDVPLPITLINNNYTFSASNIADSDSYGVSIVRGAIQTNTTVHLLYYTPTVTITGATFELAVNGYWY